MFLWDVYQTNSSHLQRMSISEASYAKIVLFRFLSTIVGVAIFAVVLWYYWSALWAAMIDNSAQNTSLLVFTAATAFAMLLLIASKFRNSIQFLLLRGWYLLPGIGKISLLATDLNKNAHDGWYNSERELCQSFERFVPSADSYAHYDRATDYLKKAWQLGRHDPPWFVWPVVFGLLVAEAGSLGLLLAIFVAPSATFAQQSTFGWAVATVFAVTMLFITHQAGREIYLNSLRRIVREMHQKWSLRYSDSARDVPWQISIEETYSDNAAPGWLQLANRLEVDGARTNYHPVYAFQIIALLLVMLFAVASFLLRKEVFLGMNTSMLVGAPDGPINRGADVAFVMLSAVFVAVQVVSGSIGYHYGFSTNVAREAARIRGPYLSRETFELRVKYRMNYIVGLAQRYLLRLQLKMSHNFPEFLATLPHERTFLKFLEEFRRSEDAPSIVR